MPFNVKAAEGANVRVGGSGGSESAELHFNGLLAIVIVVSVLVFIWAYIGGGGQRTAPKFADAAPDEIYAGLNKLVGIAGDLVGDQSTGHEWRQPDYDARKNVTLPHRYPTVSGQNISTVIHHGFDSMMRPAPTDADWMVYPPTGVEW